MDISDLIKQNSLFLNKGKSFFKNKFSQIENLNTKKLDPFYDNTANKLGKLFFYLIIIFLIVIIVRLLSLQVIDFEKYRLLSEKNYLRSEVITPNRGLIVDRNGEILVKNIPKYVLNQNLSKCRILKENNYDNCRKELLLLSNFIEINTKNIFEKYNDKVELLSIKKEITKEEAIRIGSLRDLKSIEISVTPLREYTFPISMSQLLGYVGPSSEKIGVYVGKQGIEEYYDNILSGVPGQIIYKSDSLNNKLDEYSKITPISGKDIKLSIDSKLQEYSFELLKDKVTKTPGIKGGAIVVQDPRNGEVLSLVNYPSFNLNQMTKGISEKDYQDLINQNNFPFLNRCVSSVYAPGSVFKLVTASGILEQGIATPQDKIFDEGFIKIGEYRFNNWKLNGHGEVDITRAVKVSNDTYFYIYSGGYEGRKALGISGIYNWARKFGFGEKTGIDIPGEVKGYVPDGKSKNWYLGDTFITAIGQGDLLSTPIQVSTLTSYFANNQKAMAPRIVNEIGNLKKKDKVLYENLLSQKNFEVVKNSLKEVNSYGGTAYPFFDFEAVHGFSSGGKTGTSEYFDVESGKMLTHAWYSGFAPYDNATIVVTVFLESGGGRADDSAPIARKIIDFYLK